MIDYSVLMPVYGREDPAFLSAAVRSMLEQSVSPSEFVLVCDGPLTDCLEEVIAGFRRERPIFHLVRFRKRRGVAEALRAGVQCCRCEWIARMDSDDIALPDRIEKQMHLIEISPHDLALTSGTIQEFLVHPGDLDSYRRLPLSYDAICSFAKRRNPMNHMAVMMKREAVLSAGSYRNVKRAEDYDLWVRMLMKGYMAENLDDVLVCARTGNGMQARRGGWEYARESVRLQKIFYEEGFLNRREYMENCLLRCAVSLLPQKTRRFLYRHVLRDDR